MPKAVVTSAQGHSSKATYTTRGLPSRVAVAIAASTSASDVSPRGNSLSRPLRPRRVGILSSGVPYGPSRNPTEENRGSLALDITLSKRTEHTAGIKPAISGVLTTYEIMVLAIRDDHSWDILFDVDAEPKRALAAVMSAISIDPTRWAFSLSPGRSEPAQASSSGGRARAAGRRTARDEPGLDRT
jgi:hypothetical protein